jgi:hypothetical protein
LWPGELDFSLAEGKSDMRRVVLLTLAALTLGVSIAIARADNSASDDWRSQLIVATENELQLETYSVVTSRPMTDNDVIVPWLRENQSRLQPMFIFELSRRLLASDRDAALEWFVVADLRVVYDARRCSDPTVASDGAVTRSLAKRLAEPVVMYIPENGRAYLAALRRAAARRDLFVYETSPSLICAHGITAYGTAPSLEQARRSDTVRAPAEWPGIERKLREELPHAIARIEQNVIYTERRRARADDR